MKTQITLSICHRLSDVFKNIKIVLVFALVLTASNVWSQQIDKDPAVFAMNDEPMQLAPFTVTNEYGIVYVDWVIQKEANGCVYSVERSSDEINFKSIGVRKGVVSPRAMYYSSVDPKPTAASYYRLKKMQHDGKVSYSEVYVLSSL